jgi:pimeloyl-ACP methyl ester carboxylesterase
MPKGIPIVLLPGLDGTGASFYPLLPHLSPEFVPVVVNYPRDRPLGYDELLPLVLPRIPRKPFVLLGESFGGPLALKVAGTQPAGMLALILCSTFMRNPVRFQPAWLRHLVWPGRFGLYPQFAQMKAKFRGYSTPDLREFYVKEMKSVQPAVIADRIRSALAINVQRELAQCAAPVLYLRGRKDRLIARHNMLDMQRCQPNMRTLTLDAAHCVLQLRPAEAKQAILNFVGDAPPPQ